MASSAKVKGSKGVKTFSASEVVKHQRKEDLYLVIHDKVYDVTSFVEHHPQVSSAALGVTGRV
jgi:cytochrome b involved in lipid metabolism